MAVNALGPEWLDPQSIINAFGAFAIAGVAAIIFAETGLLIGFFLPGDSLLFTTGLLVATGFIDAPLWVVCLVMGFAAFMGDQCGFYIGRKTGPRVFNKPNSRVFKQEYVDKTYAYFEKYGGRTIVMARFVPIVRTFAPVVAGVAGMEYKTFVKFNLIGALLWGVGVTLLGYLLGQIEFVQQNIELILIGIVGVSVIPMAIEYWRHRRRPAPRRVRLRRRGEVVPAHTGTPPACPAARLLTRPALSPCWPPGWSAGCRWAWSGSA